MKISKNHVVGHTRGVYWWFPGAGRPGIGFQEAFPGITDEIPQYIALKLAGRGNSLKENLAALSIGENLNVSTLETVAGTSWGVFFGRISDLWRFL